MPRRSPGAASDAGLLFLDAPISGGARRAARRRADGDGLGPRCGFREGRGRPRCGRGQGSPARRPGWDRCLGEDGEPAPCRRAHRRCLRGDHARGQARARPPAVYEVITGSAGNSWMFENRVPHVLAGDYTPISSVDIFVKDLGIVQDMARTSDIPRRWRRGAADVSRRRWRRHGADDDSSLARIYARLSGSPCPETPDAQLRRQSHHDVQRGAVSDRFAAAATPASPRSSASFPTRSRRAAGRDAGGAGLSLALFNLAPGDSEAGDRGVASDSRRAFDELRASVEQGIEYALATGARRIHMMAGMADNRDPAAMAAYSRALDHAARPAGGARARPALEPINGRNMPGYFLNDFGLAERLIAECGAPNVRLQYDVFHRQILHGDVTCRSGGCCR